jgi:hypothetical protein
MKTIREKIWYFLADSKTNEYYSSRILKLYQKLDFASNIFLVVVTSSSIAAWAIWQRVPWLWIIIFSISQILLLIKPYLPISKYIKLFNEKSSSWQQLSIDIEELWHEINYGHKDDEISAIKYFELKRKALLFDSTPDEIIFINYSTFRKKAEKSCNIYLNKI